MRAFQTFLEVQLGPSHVNTSGYRLVSVSKQRHTFSIVPRRPTVKQASSLAGGRTPQELILTLLCAIAVHSMIALDLPLKIIAAMKKNPQGVPIVWESGSTSKLVNLKLLLPHDASAGQEVDFLSKEGMDL